MNDSQSWRIAVGLHNMNKCSRTAPKNKFSTLYLAFRMFLIDILFLALLTILTSLTITNYILKNGAKIHRTILFTTLCYYYFKCSTYLFICGDISLNPGPNQTDNHFKTMHWNCNSIVAHNYHRVALLEAHNTTKNYHIIGITETALRNDIPDENLQIDGYSIIRNDLPDGDSHGGVMIYFKTDLGVKHRLDIQNHSNTLVIEISISRKKFFYVLACRKHGTPDQFKLFMSKLEETMEQIESENPYCTIICGDFNAHSNDWYGNKTDNFGVEMQKFFDETGMTQLVKDPTYITNNSRTCIDLVATDQPNLVLVNEVHPSLHKNCHHQINHTKFNLKCPPPPPFKRILWHYSRANDTAIRQALLNYDWETALGNLAHAPDEQVEHFDEVVMNVAKNFIPFEDKMIYPRDPPWVTKNSKDFYNRYRRKFKKILKNGCPAPDKMRIDNMKNEYNTLVEKEKYMRSLGSDLSNPLTAQQKILVCNENDFEEKHYHHNPTNPTRRHLYH